jgi:hypothetical protein
LEVVDREYLEAAAARERSRMIRRGWQHDHNELGVTDADPKGVEPEDLLADTWAVIGSIEDVEGLVSR